MADDSKGAAPAPTPEPAPRFEAVYDVCRDKIKNENELTNQRLTWNFLVQGFLFTAYAYCLQAIANVQVKLAEQHLDPDGRTSLHAMIANLTTAIHWLAGAGALVSIFILLAAIAAQMAIRGTVGHLYLHYLYLHYLPSHSGRWWTRRTHFGYFPGVLGGGRDAAHWLGLVAPILIPLALSVVWIILATRTVQP